MNKFTITQFRAAYPNDDACLDKIFQLRYNNLVCPICESDKPFTRVKNRRSYQCSTCGHQIYPTQGTIFEKTTTPLNLWFSAIYLQTTTRNGVAAKELERQFDICYKTALRMAHQIKILMANKNSNPLAGVVQVDETYIGGKMRFKHKSERAANAENQKSSVDNKVGVMGFIDDEGKVKAEVMQAGKTFKDRVRDNVDTTATLVTDSHFGYKGLDIEYHKHEIINHFKDEYMRDGFHTNTIEGFWAQLKRTVTGTHIHVSEKHLQKYIDEVAFRYMNKDRQATMFETILQNVV
jgi:transposase